MARPKKRIDKDEFEKLCALQCTLEEICAFLDVSAKTLENWCKENYKDDEGNGLSFSKVFAIKRGLGKVSLRRKQWKLADKSAAMAIFLGKNILGQTDQHDVNVNDNDQVLEFIRAMREK